VITQGICTLGYNSLHISLTELNKCAFDFLKSFIHYERMADKIMSSVEVEYYYEKDRHYKLEQGQPERNYFRVCRPRCLCREAGLSQCGYQSGHT